MALTPCLLVSYKGLPDCGSDLNRKNLSTLTYINEYGFIVSVHL